MTSALKAANLLQMLRTNTPGAQLSAVGVECLLRLTEGPKTAAQLCTETGCHHGTLVRQLHRFCVVYDARAEEIKQPDLKLIERSRRTGKLQGHIYQLSEEGALFLRTAGIA